MILLLKNLVLSLLLAVGVSMPSVTFAFQLPELDAVEAKYDRTLDERGELIERLESLEDRYRGLVRRIDSLKSSGAMSNIGGRLELQNLLSQSKALADELDGLQARVRSLDTRIAGQRSKVITGIDQRITKIERGLASASASERRAAVAELNALRKRRAAYSTPLPEVPSSSDVSSALELAEEAAHPDELMAAADELQDTEDQLKRRLQAIDAKLDELRNARALVRRARTFSREERFFEETDRDRVIARYDRVTRTERESGGNNASAGGGEPEVTSGTQDDSVNGSANNAMEPNEGAAGAPIESDADFSANDGAAREEADITDSPTGAPVAEEPPAASDPFETSRETIVIDGGGDPSRSVGAVSGSGQSLDGQIDRLEKEQEKLKKQANELRRRARQLRDQAEEM